VHLGSFRKSARSAQLIVEGVPALAADIVKDAGVIFDAEL